jgi:hypothetical protein
VSGFTQAGPDCVHQSGPLQAYQRATRVASVQRDKETVTEAERAPTRAMTRAGAAMTGRAQELAAA